MLLRLQKYNLKVVYLQGSKLVIADTLSRVLARGEKVPFRKGVGEGEPL